MSKLSLIIPCYNETATLARIIEKALSLKRKLDLEIIIVDDCSTDNSYHIAQSLQKKYPKIIRVFKNKVNQGKGASLRIGFSKATGDFIGVQDADMEYNPTDYITLVDILKTKDTDVVFGSRYLRPNNHRALYFWHTLMNKFLTFCSNMFTNFDITDMETCYKLFRKSALQKILPELQENRFGFEPEITMLLAKKRMKVWECAIEYNPRSYDEGKKIGWKDGFRALYCIIKYGAPDAPLPMQFLLYLFIGAISALCNILAFVILYMFPIDLSHNIILSFLISAWCNYWLCLRLLFTDQKKWAGFSQLMKYILVVGIMGSVDFCLTYALLYFAFSTTMAKAIASICGIFGNFYLRKYFVFKKIHS